MILHGKDLIVSIDGNSMLASKSCTLSVSAKTITKTSPTSGEWEEVLSGKKSWSLSTDHLVKNEESSVEPPVGNLSLSEFYFSNSIAEGWKARGEYTTLNKFNCFDEYGDTTGITTIEINSRGNVSNIFNFDRDGYGTIGGSRKSLYQYLNGEVTGYVPRDSSIIAILTVGEFSIGSGTVTLLYNTYHVALPCIEFGNNPTSGTKTYDSSPIIIVGGKSITHGFSSLNSISNEVFFNLASGQVFTPEQGIPNNINMVGKKVTIRMTDSNGNYWAGQAIVKQFKVTGTKGNLMAGSFSFAGNGELQTDSRLEYAPTPTPSYVNRIIVDLNQSDPAQMVTGDINGDIFKEIMENTHRYLCKYQGNGNMAMYQLNDNNSSLFEDGAAATLDGTMGDVYVRLGGDYNGRAGEWLLYYRVSQIGTKKYELAVSSKNMQGFNVYNVGQNLIAAFKAQATTSYDNNVAGEAGGTYYLRSILADRASIEDTVANLNAAKQLMNTNYFGFVGPEEHALVAILYYLKYGNTNSQTMCGNGASAATITGTSVYMGVSDTDAFSGASAMNIFGLENWWGGGAELMERMRYANGKIYTTPWGETEDAGTAAGLGENVTESVIQNMLFQANPLLMIPQGTQPIDTDYGKSFCDALAIQNANDSNICRGKGGGDAGGIAWMGLGASGNVGTRLCYHGNTEELYDIDYFINEITAVDPAN